MWMECCVKQHPCAFLLWMRWENVIVCSSFIIIFLWICFVLLVFLTFNISAFHFLLHWISWSPDHYHYDYLSNPDQPIPLSLRDGVCSSYWATHPCTLPVLPSILCSSHRGEARCESWQSSPHHPSWATGHRVGFSYFTGWPFSHGVHLPWSSAACSGTSLVHCRYGCYNPTNKA